MSDISALSSEEKRVHRIDTLRQAADGVFKPLVDSVFLIVVIHFFSVGDFWKGLISASTFIGFFLSVPLTGMLYRSSVPRSRILMYLTFLSALGMAAGTFSGSGIMFALSVTASSAAVSLRQPFFTDLYREQYPADRRAKQISLGLRSGQVISLSMGLLYGRLLDVNLDSWRWITAAAILVFVFTGIELGRLPGRPVVPGRKPWLQALSIPFRNPLFLYIQASWMLIGFGNLWTLPLKVVYLSEEGRGLGLSPAMVTLIIVAIPSLMKLLFNPFWAGMYQKLSFPVFRISLNIFFMLSLGLFFLTGSLPLIILASVFFGMGTSGSPFVWQLWVTRIAPADETRVYQSAHAFLAGVRGVVAPFLGFAVLRQTSFRTMGLISALLALVATLMILPLLRRDRRF
jgi:MFS family permease